MNLDEETLLEIEDYINSLEERFGLKPETMLDIEQAIISQRKLNKKNRLNEEYPF